MGYIYLKDWRKIVRCQWQRGYVSDWMFVRYKPMYQALARHVGLVAERTGDMDAVGDAMAN